MEIWVGGVMRRWEELLRALSQCDSREREGNFMNPDWVGVARIVAISKVLGRCSGDCFIDVTEYTHMSIVETG